jgi:hypothetical protein
MPTNNAPIQGGRRIDLLRVYKHVTEQGGYHAVSRSRGWRDIAVKFGLDPNNANASYNFKVMYTKFLWTYEMEHFWKAKPSLGKPEDMDGPWNLIQVNLGPAPLVTPEGGMLKRPMREMHAPYISSHQPNSMVAGVPTMRPHVSQLVAFGSSLPAFPTLAEPPVAIHPAMLHRIILALKSQLLNEIDWVYNKLVEASYHPGFQLRDLTFVMDMVCEHTRTVAAKTRGLTLVATTGAYVFQPTTMRLILDALGIQGMTPEIDTQQDPYTAPTFRWDNPASGHRSWRTERVLQTITMVRNLSFMEDNQKELVNNESFMGMLRCGLDLLTQQVCEERESGNGWWWGDDGSDGRIEYARMCLDTIENIASEMELVSHRKPTADKKPDDPTAKEALDPPSQLDPLLLCVVVLFTLGTYDRYLTLTCLSILTKLHHRDRNLQQLALISVPVLERVAELLLLPADEELAWAALDWLYQWSASGYAGYALATKDDKQGMDKARFNRCIIRRLVEIVAGDDEGGWWEALDDEAFAQEPTIVDKQPQIALSDNFSDYEESDDDVDVEQVEPPPPPKPATLAGDTPEMIIAREWLKQNFVPAPGYTISLAEVFLNYTNFRREQSTPQTPIQPLSAQAFVAMYQQVFPDIPFAFHETATGEKVVAVNGLKRVVPTIQDINSLPPDQLDVSYCHWINCTNPVKDISKLEHHVRSVHLNVTVNSYKCEWRHCGRVFHKPAAWRKIAFHIRSHFSRPSLVRIRKHPVMVTMQEERNNAADGHGMDTTACLILRNLARESKTRGLVRAFEDKFVLVLMRKEELSGRLLKLLEYIRQGDYDHGKKASNK